MDKARAQEIMENMKSKKVAEGFCALIGDDIEGNEEKIGAMKDFNNAVKTLGLDGRTVDIVD